MVYRAAWVLPIVAPPIAGGWVAVRAGRVEQVGQGRPPAILAESGECDLGAVAVLPGLVNAHTHLELASLRGRVPPASSLPAWVCDLLSVRGFEPPPLDPIRTALAEARQAGTALLGDVSNSLASFPPLLASPVAALVFHEVLGFRPDGASAIVENAARAVDALPATDRVRVSLAVHAPYSSSPELFRAVRRWLDRQRPSRATTLHLGESPEEVRFLRDGSGAWRELLEEFRVWNPIWVAPACEPVEYIARLGFVDGRLLVAHGVQLEAHELARLRDAGATLVTCPRSNQWVGVGAPPVARFYASGIRVAVGTDSLASAPDLNLFAELAELRQLAREVPARTLLESATRNGADALGFPGELGVIAPGARADLLAVAVSPGVTDVEEYLVGGVWPEQVRWIRDIAH